MWSFCEKNEKWSTLYIGTCFKTVNFTKLYQTLIYVNSLSCSYWLCFCYGLLSGTFKHNLFCYEDQWVFKVADKDFWMCRNIFLLLYRLTSCSTCVWIGWLSGRQGDGYQVYATLYHLIDYHLTLLACPVWCMGSLMWLTSLEQAIRTPRPCEIIPSFAGTRLSMVLRALELSSLSLTHTH